MLACVALWILNAALTFHNRWPTFWTQLEPELSVELMILLLGLALGIVWRGPPGHRVHGLIVGGYAFLTLCRYLEVTVPALVGRRINLYWDGPHIPGVIAMMVDGFPWWQLGIGIMVLLLVLLLLVTVLNWAIGMVVAVLTEPTGRRVVSIGAASTLALLIAGLGSSRVSTERWFALPVTGMFVEQAKFFLQARVLRHNERFRKAPPLMVSDLSRLHGRDVFILFYESYGGVVFDRPIYVQSLENDFANLQQTLEKLDWRMASARVGSTTFGGASWLAHASFLSGLRIADQGDYQLLLTTDRITLIDRFRDAGYRCVALMPGLKQTWLEGRYYGFDRVYTAAGLDYPGPAFGWWTIPDQFSLYRLHRNEVLMPKRSPLLVFFTTITSHAPFAPVPPYAGDWQTLTAASPYADLEFRVNLEQPESITDLKPAYIAAIRYNLQLLGGYLSEHAPADALFVVLGDHQPPALVSGQGVSWEVPVHILSRDKALIEAFLAAGFTPGLVPDRRVIGGMETLNPLLLNLLDSSAADSQVHNEDLTEGMDFIESENG